MIVNITPVPKPRMTQRDRWERRPCVVEYWRYKDALLRAGVDKVIESGVVVVFFVFPPPASWSKKKCISMMGRAHRVKPDLDNLVKGLLDIVKNDSHVHTICAYKTWGETGRVDVKE